MNRPTPNNNQKTFGKDEIVVSKTDLKGNITYGNELFIKLSGYSEEELLGAPHNLIRHPDMPAIVFKLLWDTVQAGNEIFAYVINLAKDGSYYWVFANVTPSFDNNGKIIGYHSVRRSPDPKKVDIVKGLYSTLLTAEKKGGMNESLKLLTNLLEEKGTTYEKFILSL